MLEALLSLVSCGSGSLHKLANDPEIESVYYMNKVGPSNYHPSKPAPWVHQLPDEVFGKILAEVLHPERPRSADVATMRLVCRQWKHLVNGHLPEAHLRVSDASARLLLSAFTNLRTVKLSALSEKAQLTDRGLFELRRAPGLTHVQLQACHELTGAGFSVLQLLPRLQRLELEELSGLDDGWMSHLAGLRLTHLSIECCSGVTDKGLQALQALTMLRTVSLAACPQLTDAGLPVLAALTGLQRLDLWGISHLTGSGLRDMACLPQLGELSLANCESLSNDGLAAVAALRGLTELTLSLAASADVTSEGLEPLARLQRLQRLEIKEPWKHHFCDAALGPVGQLRRLRELKLDSWRRLSDDGLGALSQLRELTTLVLSDCSKLTPAGLHHLQPLARLAKFYCFGCAIKRSHISASPHMQLVAEVVVL